MKRTIILLLLIFLVVSIDAQVVGNVDSLNLREYGDRYLIPKDTCNREINLDLLFISPYADDFMKAGIFQVGGSSYRLSCDNVLNDFAQPYTPDTTLRIVGVSGYIGILYIDTSYSDSYKFYYEIRDSSLTNILLQADVWPAFSTTHFGSQAYRYTEVFFDTSIDISNKFYVVFHTPDTVVPSLSLYYKNIGGSVWGTAFNCVEDYPLTRANCETQWSYIYPFIDESQGQLSVLYLFPILDSNYIGSSDLNTVRDISQFTHVFPNPTKQEVNINCGYKIKALQVFDEQGKRLFEKEINAYNYQINLENYPTGTYLIKVLTNNGQTTKRVIKE